MALTVSSDLSVSISTDQNVNKLTEKQEVLKMGIQKGEPKSIGVFICMIFTVLAAVISVIAAIFYIIDIVKHPQTTCQPNIEHVCDEEYFATRLSVEVKSILLSLSVVQTAISSAFAFVLYKERQNFNNYMFFVTLAFILSTLTRQNVGAVSETASTMWQSAHSAVRSLGDDAHSYLVSLLGKHSVDTLYTTIEDAIKVTSEASAHALNVVAAYITDFLGDSGTNVKLPVKHFTAEGVVFVTRWALLALLGYWLLYLALGFVAGFLRRTLFLLKVIFVIVTFGLIVSDGGASPETTATRLAGLVFTCILLGIGPSFFRGDANSHLEQKVKLLEKRLREMEKQSKYE
ncbi:hypothetical protein Baya_1906 [Bagarius yarrelli]|uniref:Uncharacterized protein n=1 Tax=Bagarius yarrelli TaxID=175774 RepID=A0A556TMF4_BAGYA|nr:hypothetical protein Baya_1906 [Bagarius yarrelli]